MIVTKIRLRDILSAAPMRSLSLVVRDGGGRFYELAFVEIAPIHLRDIPKEIETIVQRLQLMLSKGEYDYDSYILRNEHQIGDKTRLYYRNSWTN